MKDVVIFVNAIRPATFEALERHAQATGEHFTPIVLVDENIQTEIEERNGQLGHLEYVARISVNFDSAESLHLALAPYEGRIFAVTSQYENSVHELKKLVPHLPYLDLPTETSLEWATDKRHMRRLLEAYDRSLTPAYVEVHDASQATIRAVERRMSYPVIVKPSGLEGSLLVSRANDAHELREAIARTAEGMRVAYDKWIKRQRPAILVEEFMQGQMYSIDTYVSATGICRHTPPVRVITGHDVGFDDFFGYARLTPAGLTHAEVTAAQQAAEQAVHALGLRSVTAHVELMQTAEGWKIIELAPRIGGYRHEIYSLGYSLNHVVNDILNRGGSTPVIPTEPITNVAFHNIYAPEEGILRAHTGLKQVMHLPSYRSHKQLYQIGESVAFAKNNGDPIFEVMLAHPDRNQLESDMRSLQDLIKFEVAVLQSAN